MKKLGEGYFRYPRVGKSCFGAAIINWLKLHDVPIDDTKLYKRYEESSYTDSNGGTCLFLGPRQVEYVTSGMYTGKLYHSVEIKGKDLDSHSLCFPEKRKSFIRRTLQEELNSGRLIYSIEDMKRLVYYPNTKGVIASIFDPFRITFEDFKVVHAIVQLNPSIFPPRSFIDSSGNIYQFESDEITQFAGVLELKKT